MVRFAILLAAAAVGLSLAASRLALPSAAADRPTLVAEPLPVESAAAPTAGQELVLTRDGSGQFGVDAVVNGQSLPFLIDTGADRVALTVESARAAGLYVDPTGFQEVAVGASGPVRGEHVTLARLDVAGRSLEQVDALVLEGLGTNLLGQSVLRQLGAVEMHGDQMVLR